MLGGGLKVNLLFLLQIYCDIKTGKNGGLTKKGTNEMKGVKELITMRFTVTP